MAETSPVRPARRAAQGHRALDSSNEDLDAPVKTEPLSDHETYQTSPKKVATRRATRSKPMPRSQNVNDEALNNTAEPLKKAPKPRRNVRASRRSMVPVATDSPTGFSASTPSAIPDRSIKLEASATQGEQSVLQPLDDAPPSNGPRSPLSDKSEAALNEQPTTTPLDTILHKPVAPIVAAKPQTIMERPMDIVVRARAKAVPLVQEPAEAKPRMVITYLVLTNFKSYAGRQEVGPFHASFSSVVGPNGSGKSNVIDSLLFVFGFRASKMRQGKISALIHNSAAHPDLDCCEVEVHFQEVIDRPGGSHEIVPDSSIIVSRKVFKNNSSKYYINNAESTFTVVTTLLRDRGVDLDHKRFLILQGEVESIAQMKPKAANEHDDGLLEYLEDIIGTSKFKTPIEESATETETLNEVCIEKNNRVAHVEKERKGLEGKKDVALAYIKDENDLAVKQSALYQIFVAECDDNIQVTAEALEQVQKQLDEELTKHSSSEEEIKALRKSYTKELKQFELLEQDTQANLKRLAKADKDGVKFEEKRKHLSAKVKKLDKSSTAGKAGLSEATAYLGRLEEDLVRNSEEVRSIEGQLRLEEQELARIRESLKGKTEGLSEQIGHKQNQLEPWTRQIDEQESAIALANSELAILRERENAGAESVREAKERLEKHRLNHATKASGLEAYKAEMESLHGEKRQLESSLHKLVQTESERRTKLSTARQKADEARASLTNTQTRGNVLSGLKRLRDSGRVTGFHGRLGDLGTIDSKYDVAISTACPALDNIVVESVDVGQQCIEHLRKNNLGRANFILLDRLTQRDLSPIETPDDVPRLFDLVKAKDERLRPAFFNVLQNTLVAQDLDHANRIAYGAKRWRVVTLDGQLIDKSGTMSGGGTRVAKGAMSSKLVADTSKEQILQLEAKTNELEEQFQDFQKERQDTEAAIRRIDQKLPSVETLLQRIALELESLDKTMRDAEMRQKELGTVKQKGDGDAVRSKALESVIAKAQMEIEKLSGSSRLIEEEIQVLQEKIMEVGGIKLRSQKAKVDGLKEQLAALVEEMSNAEVNKSKMEKQTAKHDKAIREAEKDLEVVAQDMEKLDEESKSHDGGMADSKRLAEEAQEALTSKRETLEAMKASVDQKTAEVTAARATELEVRNQLEEHQKVLAENQKRLKYWQEKLSKLTLQDLSDLGEQGQQAELPIHSRDELMDLDKNVLKGEIAILEEKTQNVQVELGVLAEYRKRVEEHAARSSDLATAVASRDSAKKRCEELRRLRLEGFMEGFSTISLRLKEMYQMITMGGNAELELVDSLDPFSEGILFSVMPPKKSWKNISNLSGGEKTLSSLALVFALHHYKPTPLYVMDEIDAALDFRNVSIVASYIKERTKNAQFIVISLRNNMFELASRLVGVYKVNHMTKSVTVENRDLINRS